jgi:hypothetical protein
VFDITSDGAGRSAVAKMILSRRIAQTKPGVSGGQSSVARREQNPFPFDGRAAAEEKIAQLRSVIFAILLRVQSEEDATSWLEMVAIKIVEKKTPFGGFPPPITFALAVEVDRKGRDQIEFALEIGQRFMRPNGPDAPLNLKQIEQLREKWKLVDIQTERGMSEVLRDKKKKSAPATQVENRSGLGSVES